MPAYNKEVTYTPAQQEEFSQLVNARLRALDWTRKEASEVAGVSTEQVSALSRTAPTGMPYGYFLKVMLALDIDLYEVCELLGLDTEVKEQMTKNPTRYPNAYLHFGGKKEKDPLTSLVKTLPSAKQEQARNLIEAILRNV